MLRHRPWPTQPTVAGNLHFWVWPPITEVGKLYGHRNWPDRSRYDKATNSGLNCKRHGIIPGANHQPWGSALSNSIQISVSTPAPPGVNMQCPILKDWERSESSPYLVNRKHTRRDTRSVLPKMRWLDMVQGTRTYRTGICKWCWNTLYVGIYWNFIISEASCCWSTNNHCASGHSMRFEVLEKREESQRPRIRIIYRDDTSTEGHKSCGL